MSEIGYRSRKALHVGIPAVALGGVLFALLLFEPGGAPEHHDPEADQALPAITSEPQTRFAAFSDVCVRSGVHAKHAALRNKARPIDFLFGQAKGKIRYLMTGQAWGDYDRDGWVDLYVTDQLGPNTLYHNDGDGSFSVSPLSEAVGLPGARSGGAVFADYDNDG